MCGICGWVGREPSAAPERIDLMLRALKKRGPDDAGVWNGNGKQVVLGHTRLSIIDLEGSAQPMANEDDTVFVTYNGELYNYQELRRSLISGGHSFRTRGDTEVLVHLYEDHGPEMVEHLDGMFAFGIYDARRHSLLLARDRIGIKPLYYWHSPVTGELLFASDMSAILANPAVPRRLDPRALAQYLYFGYVVPPQGWLEHVSQLEPGETVEWKDGAVRRAKYYTWTYNPQSDLAHPATAVTCLEDIVSSSVKSHLIADVPLGSFLSGGLDSGTVTGFAQRAREASGASIESFTVRFWDPKYDESQRARSVASDLGTLHTEIDAKQLTFDRVFIETLIDALGEPFADTSALAVYLLCQQARPYVKVALSGDGGDEIFYGYTGLTKQRIARRFRVVPRLLRRIGARATAGNRAAVARKLGKALQLSLLDDPGIILDWCRRWGWSELRGLLGEDLFDRLFPSDSALFPDIRSRIGNGETGGFGEQQLRFHMSVDLPCDCLFKVDRMSMAHGLEVRVPLLSDAMLGYSARLPFAARFGNGRTKEPLRTLAESLSPTLARPSGKHGFSFPLDSWIGQRLIPYWREWGLTGALGKAGFQTAAIENLLTRYGRHDPLQQSYDSRRLSSSLFDLLLLAVWLDKYQLQS